MGTNFFSLNGQHIGRRSAAGDYCWDCGWTLCKAGVDKIHSCHYNDQWHTCCPKCGKTNEEPISKDAVARELGFNTSKPQPKSGVATCSSFLWAVKPDYIDSLQEVIVDEYGRRYTLADFKDVLSECPVQYHDLVGEHFR